MKNWKVLMVLSITLLALTSLGSAGEILYTGIELPEQWPPQYDKITRDPMPVPYLENIPDDVGRQLFADDFLIQYNRRRHKTTTRLIIILQAIR